MNILICNSYKVYKNQGGTERISSRIACGLTALGHRCFLAYKHDLHLDEPETCFVHEVNASKESLEQFIVGNKIDCVIVQKMTRDVRLMVDIRHILQHSSLLVQGFCIFRILRNMSRMWCGQRCSLSIKCSIL